VHKEAIDKIPNALPHRNNIEIEIYGMEGIPDADMKEHEAQKKSGGGGRQRDDSSDEEPETPVKKIKVDNLQAPPQQSPMGMMAPMPGAMMNQPLSNQQMANNVSALKSSSNAAGKFSINDKKFFAN